MRFPRSGTDAALVVRSDRRFWLGRTAAGTALMAGCGWAMTDDSRLMPMLGGAGVMLFGALTLFGLRQLLRRGPRLTLSAAGVDARDLRLGEIPWADIEAVEIFGSAEAPFLALRVAEAAPYPRRAPWWPRSVARLLHAQGLPLFSVNLIGVDRSTHEILRYAAARIRRGVARGP